MTHLESNNIRNINLKEASIQVSLNGFSFCILDKKENKIFYFKKIHFQKKLNPTEVLQQIKLLYAKEPKLQEKIDQVEVIFANDLYSLLPHIFFKEENASDYLKYNAKILQTDLVAHDIIPHGQIVNVYVPFTNISNYFFELYGEFEYKHSISILLEHLMEINNLDGQKMFLNNCNNYFDLAVFENGKLQLCNSFTYETKEDFIYYILFTAEQLGFDTKEFELILMGEIAKDSELYNIAYTYIQNIDFFKDEKPYEFEIPEAMNGVYDDVVLLKSVNR